MRITVDALGAAFIRVANAIAEFLKVLGIPQAPIEKTEQNDHLGPTFTTIEGSAPERAHGKGLCSTEEMKVELTILGRRLVD